MRQRKITLLVGILATCVFSVVVAEGLLESHLYARVPQVDTAKAADSDTGRSVWDSVYSASQAEAGKRVFTDSCATCHGDDLSGGHGPGLRGDKFLLDWGAGTLERLYTRTKTLMPQGAPGSLRDEDYLALVSYILQVNEFPAGSRDLTAADLKDIHIYGKDGPEFVPDFALVQVVACLAQSNDTWMLTAASKPVMTLDPKASKGDALKQAGDKPLGAETYKVVDAVPAPDASSKDHKVEAKGFLMRKPQSGISITSLQVVAATCTP